jgi:O-succinylbenzoic acid--CoA ligase
VSGLHIGGRFIAYQDLADYSMIAEHGHATEAIDFCKSYLSNAASYQLATSGSTGASKNITLSRNQLQASARMTIEALALKTHYRALLCISTAHIGGIMMLVRGMELNMEVVLIDPPSKLNTKDLLAIDFVALVPLQLKQLIGSNSGRQFLEDCKVIILGGAKIDPVLEEQLAQIHTPIYHSFGMTETASHFALRKLTNPNKQKNYHVLPGIQIDTDQRGCLVVNGETTNNIPLITNDLIRIVDSNSFIWLGRWDRVINTGGFKVNPESIEPLIANVFKDADITSDFAVVGLPHPKWGEQVTLVIEGMADKAVLCNLLEGIQNNIHPYEMPKEIRSLNSLPKTRSGKIDYPRLVQILTKE